ncbi:MAG: hypothetical protein GTO45_33120 [Candidatus Aminicenantes bacterium]|nr:hypothetical protein [Candidatus Aminicenantes bacterium]NIM83582.1 hypothetical protein [Candidatus Aminicenantes bacterium]NIN22983.1 hypothetical protein [Candidatus Aminicenantes bacterium]NIN46720.1 hypothetical protein [Candidatus Aminicenantes bacterium]NIN89626.1 hypothetical protein [Candidatus Aminicenantes bacterium]
MKVKKTIIIAGLLLVGLMTQFCGAKRFVTPAFYEKTAGHRIIAIAPYEMIFTGKKPKKLTVQDIREIEEIESLAFQESLYHCLMRQATRNRRPIRVEIMPIKKTNRILEKHGIDIRDSWDMTPEELARILRVDAVVKTRVEKRRYMSGLASFGVEAGSVILSHILDDSPFDLWINLPTSGIRAECFLYNGRDGSVLWGIDIKDETDWRMSANAIIDRINYYFAKKFPYR